MRAYLEYQSVAAFFVSDAAYLLSVGGRSADASAIEALVDRLTQTVKLDQPLREQPLRVKDLVESPSHSVAYLLGWAIPPLVLAFLLAHALRKARQRKLEAAAEAERQADDVARRNRTAKKKKKSVAAADE